MLETIVELHRQGKLEEAERRYRERLAASPDDAEALHLLGVLRRQRGDAVDAAGLVRRAIALAPDQARYYATLGGIELHEAQLDAARADFEAALRLDPNLTGAWVALARIAVLQGDPTRAESLYRHAGLTGVEAADLLVGHGDLLLQRGDTDGAIRQLTRAVERFPNDPKAQAHLGRAYLSKGLQAFGEQALNNALAIKPDYHAARLLLAETLVLARRPDEAQPHLERLATVPGQRAPALAMLGDLLRARGDLVRASLAYQEALSERPGDARLAAALAGSLMLQRRVAEAIEVWQVVVQGAPDDLEARRALAACCAEAGRVDAAREHWGYVLDRRPEDAAARGGLAALLELTGALDAATREATTLLAHHPAHGGAALILARAALRAGDARAAADRLAAVDAAGLSVVQRRLRALALGAARDALDDPAGAVEAWLGDPDESAAGLPPSLPRLAGELAEGLARARAIDPPAPGAGPEALLVGVPGSGVETVARLVAALPGVALLSDRFGSQPRHDGFSADDARSVVDADLARLFARKHARPLERAGVAAGARYVDWLPLLDARVVPTARAAFGRVRLLVVARDPRDAFLNWLAFGSVAGWSIAPAEAAARRLRGAIDHLTLAAAALPEADVLRIDPDAVLRDPAGEAARLAAFLGTPAPTPADLAHLGEAGLGGLPRSLPNGRHAAYADVLSAAFAALA